MSNSVIGASTDSEIKLLFRGKNRHLASAMIALVEEFRDYWPMTLRGFYYQAVAALLIPNNKASYKSLGALLAKLRRNDLLPWRAMLDKTRHTSEKRGVSDVGVFIEQQLETFLDSRYYGRCYIQEQDVYVEVTVEKDALSTLVENAAFMYCTRVTTTKGQISATYLEQMATRFDRAIMLGKEPILLHFGDLDPTGVQVPISIQDGLSEHHSIDVDVRMMGLTPAQCVEHTLPKSPDAAKSKDPNTQRWYRKYRDQAPTELDALHPEKLKQLVKDSLSGVYDMREIEVQKAREAEEDELLHNMRGDIIACLNNAYPDVMKEAGYL